MPKLADPVPKPTKALTLDWGSRLSEWIDRYVQLIDQGPFDVHGDLINLAGRRIAAKVITDASYPIKRTDHFLSINGAGAVTLTLPANPKIGARFEIQDSSGNAAANNISIGPPTSPALNLNGSATPVTISTNYGKKIITFDGQQYLAA